MLVHVRITFPDDIVTSIHTFYTELLGCLTESLLQDLTPMMHNAWARVVGDLVMVEESGRGT